MKRFFPPLITVSLLQLLLLPLAAQNVAINTDGSNADPSAMLDIKSTNKGMLVPRMTSAQRTAITSPAAGLMVYDTDSNTFWFFNGVGWTQMTTSGSAGPWATSGNNISNTNSGRVGIGTSSPLARFAIDSGMIIDQAQVNKGPLTSGGALLFGADLLVGIARPWLLNNPASGGLGFFTGGNRNMVLDSTGQLGIGTFNPLQALHVVGNAHISSRLGIGSGNSNPIYPLHVNGNAYISGVLNPDNPLTIGNNTTIEGNLTVNTNKGILRNSGSAQLKYYTQESSVIAILGPLGTSVEGNIAWPAGIFTKAPAVIVGDIVVTGGTVGTLYRVQLVTYNATTTGCNFRLINTSGGNVNYNVTWNIVCIGE